MKLGAWALALAGSAGLIACEESNCEEDLRAQTELDRGTIVLGQAQLEAEFARTQVERERGWKFRRCDREALVILPETPPEAMSLWGCGLVDAVDVAFVRDGQISELGGTLEPCAEPCSGCPTIDSEAPVDAAIETLEGRFDLAVGDPAL